MTSTPLLGRCFGAALMLLRYYFANARGCPAPMKPRTSWSESGVFRGWFPLKSFGSVKAWSESPVGTQHVTVPDSLHSLHFLSFVRP